LGNYVSAKDTLAELDAFLAAGLAVSTLLKMFRHDPLAIWAVVVVVIDLPVLGWFFDGVGMVWSYFRHGFLPSGEDGRGNLTLRLVVQQSTKCDQSNPLP
jgi:hypothetical protein